MPSTSALSDALPGDPAHGIAVWHYDGISAVRRTPDFTVVGDRFHLIEQGVPGETHLLVDLVALAVGRDALYGLKGCPGWRIGFAGGVPANIAALLPGHARYGRLIDRFGLWPSIAISTVLAAGVVTAFLMTPALVARAVPASVEKRIGDVMVGDFGNRACHGGNGGAALSALLDRIDGGDPMIEVSVVNLPIVNAVTLPGGRIVIFDKLLREAQSPDEVAGVLAHEIGHVHNHDVMESLLRQLGLSVLLGGLEGNIGGYTNALLASTYSRTAEARADRYAMTMLNQAAVSPLATAAFFERVGGKMKIKGIARTANYLSSHPISSDRAAAFAAAATVRKDYRPALSPDQWAALQAICSSDRTVEKPAFRF